MKRFLLLVFVLFFGFVHLSAQSHSQRTFSKKELSLYSEIYQHKLDHPFDVVGTMQKNAKKINITERRLEVIFQAQFAGNEIQVTPEEQLELDKFQSMMAQDEAIHSEKINAFVQSKKLSLTRYSEIEKEFQKSNTLREHIRTQVIKN